jgi:hypothetical protein
MADKSVNVTSMEDLKTKVSDVEVFGDPGAWKLLGKASSKAQGWMKSTKAMDVPGGVLVQASTQQGGAVAEAITFVPGSKTEQVSGNHYRLVPISSNP